MTLAPARPQYAPSDAGGAEPTVVAVLVTRRDPQGLGDLLEAVLTQSLVPDSVLVLDRTEGRVLPAPPPVSDDDWSLVTAEEPPELPDVVDDDVGAIVRAVASQHGIPVSIRPVDPRMPVRTAVHRALLAFDDAGRPASGNGTGSTGGDFAMDGDGESDRNGGPNDDRVTADSVVTGENGATYERAVTEEAATTEETPTTDETPWGNLLSSSPQPPTLAWVVPVGTTPEPGTLVALVDTWRRSPSTAIVGPKHVDAADPHLLRALAIHTTRGGRLLDRPTPGTPDQGQYDRMTDALAVPLAGSLLERELVLALGGWESSFGDVGADLDLGWRAQNSGRRVVVVPSARVGSEADVAVATSTSPSRRRAARRVALTRARWWAVLPLALWIAATCLLTALGLLLLKRPRAAWAELSSLGALDPFRGTLARWRTRHRREVRGRDLRALFEPQRAVLSQWGDAVHDALVPPSLPMADEDNDLAPRSWLAKVVRHPGVLATVGAAAVAVVAGRSLGPSVVTGAGSGLVGGELVGSRASARTLWHAWTDGWTGAGLGGPEVVGPHVPLLAGPAWLADRLPLVPDPSSPAGAVVAVAVILGMPLAAASAYVSFRTMVTSRVVRGLVAFAWATTGVAAASVAQGRLGAVVALVLLPPLASGFWLMATRRSTATSAFATAFAAVLLGAFVPVLLALSSALALVIAAGRSRVRLHALVVAVVPLLLLGPWLVTAADTSWPELVAGVGVAQWGGTTPPPWQLALLHTGGPGAPPVWAGLPLVAVAVFALLRGRARRAAASTLAVLIPVLLAFALVAPAVRMGTVPAGVEGAGQPITLWSGTLLLPLALVLVLALAGGLDGIRLPRPSVGSRVAAVTRWTAVPVSALAVTAGAVGVSWATLGSELTPWSDPRPAVSVEQAEGAFATRVLFVAPGERGSAYRLVGREAADLVRPLPLVAEADRSLATRVTGVLGDPSTAPALFADTAADLLAVRAGLVPELTRRLDATEGLQRIAPREGWEMWRVSPAGSADGLVAPPRLRIESPSGILLVTTTGQHAATSTQVDAPPESRLVVAEALAWTEYAVVSLDAEVLEPLEGAPTPTYALPPGSGRLTITVTDPARWWHRGQLAAFLVLAFLAIPFGRRASRVGGR